MSEDIKEAAAREVARITKEQDEQRARNLRNALIQVDVYRALKQAGRLAEEQNVHACWYDALGRELDRVSAELQRFREREPLVQQLLAMVDRFDAETGDESSYAKDAAAELRAFGEPSVKCPSQDDGSADDLTPAAPVDAAESHEKTPSDAG